MKGRKNLVLTTNTLILPILWTSAQKEVSSDLKYEPSLTSLKTNPCSSPLKELYNAQPFRELLGSSPNFPTVTTGLASAGTPLPLLHSSTGRIPANNCPYQKKKSQQALRLQDMNICTVNSAPKETLVQPGKRHLTCLPRKTTPMPLQTNTYENLPCTSTDQLFTKIKKLNFWDWNPWEMHWYWGRCKFFLDYSETLPSLQREDLTPCPGCRGRKTAVCNQSVTHYFLFMPENTVSFFLHTPLLTALSVFNNPFCSENLRRSFHHSTALDFSPGQKSQHSRL